MKTFRLLAIFLALAALMASLSGCFGEDKPVRTAGGDDYPNGVEPLGKESARTLHDTADWNGFDTLPGSGPGLYDTVDVPDSVPDTAGAGPAPKKSLAAAKRAAGLLPPLDTVTIRVVDTATGAVEAVRKQVTEAGTQVDSTVFLPADSSNPDSPSGVTQVARSLLSPDSSRLDSWLFADADGDGLLAPRPGSANLARVEVSTTLASGARVKNVQILAAGPDLDFNARGDNRILSSRYLSIQGPDTLLSVAFLDADGDSAVLDLSRDSNLVDMIQVFRGASGGAVAKVTREVRIVAGSRDSSGNYAVRYAERRLFRDGGILDIAARGAGADSSFLPGAEAYWSEISFPPAADSVARASLRYRVRLASKAGDFGSNVLLGLSAEREFRKEFDRFALDFRSESPIPDGRWLGVGDVVSWLSFPGGRRLVFTGIAAEGEIKGSVAVGDSASWAVTFDRSGAIVSKP
jgi:hypothetical protein